MKKQRKQEKLFIENVKKKKVKPLRNIIRKLKELPFNVEFSFFFFL